MLSYLVLALAYTQGKKFKVNNIINIKKTEDIIEDEVNKVSFTLDKINFNNANSIIVREYYKTYKSKYLKIINKIKVLTIILSSIDYFNSIEFKTDVPIEYLEFPNSNLNKIFLDAKNIKGFNFFLIKSLNDLNIKNAIEFNKILFPAISIHKINISNSKISHLFTQNLRQLKVLAIDNSEINLINLNSELENITFKEVIFKRSILNFIDLKYDFSIELNKITNISSIKFNKNIKKKISIIVEDDEMTYDFDTNIASYKTLNEINENNKKKHDNSKEDFTFEQSQAMKRHEFEAYDETFKINIEVTELSVNFYFPYESFIGKKITVIKIKEKLN